MTEKITIRLGTRSSQLARWQADWVAEQIRQLGADVELIPITTQGDVTTGPLGQIGGIGLFTKEIQRALLDNRIDLAVHSLKDLPTDEIPGLVVSAVPPREVVGDCLIGRTAKTVETLPVGAKIGTGSLRRAAQLRAWRSDLQIADIRGNLDTRIKKLDAGDYDAIVLAAAGLTRLGWMDRVTQVLPMDKVLPAVGQGALGLETRIDDSATRSILEALNDAKTYAAVMAERSLLKSLCAGCLAPVGAYAICDLTGSFLELRTVVLSPDGQKQLSDSISGPSTDAVDLGMELAERLLAAGADKLIAAAKS